jgi:hypothetical protein
LGRRRNPQALNNVSSRRQVHIADSKTTNGIGDMPLTQAAREAFRREPRCHTAKLGTMREALATTDRQANEHTEGLVGRAALQIKMPFFDS